MRFRVIFGTLLLFSLNTYATVAGIYDGSTLQATTLEQALYDIKPGSILVLGENHGFVEHQRQQVAVMQALRNLGHRVSVGLEFFTYTDQNAVESYRAGRLSEADFLTTIGWGSPSFDFYRDQALFPELSEGAATLALNAPRALTSKVARGGLSSLTPDESLLLPPQFTVGRDSYKERFLRLMPHIPSPEAGLRYFTAQSIWDDTMAWRAADFITQHPDQIFVIVVGEFHVQFGGGLPDRLRARAPLAPIVTFSQINTAGLSDAEVAAEMEPSISEGPRADYLWLAPAEGPGL